MRRFLAARVGSAAACWLLVGSLVVRSAGAQTWNDPRSRSIVEGATHRRAEQLADTALSDSFAIGSGTARIRVYEVKVRPKDDTKPRVIGAVYIEPESRQVVRMNFSFTAAAFLDKALDELSIVLENRLVGGRFWLP